MCSVWVHIKKYITIMSSEVDKAFNELKETLSRNGISKQQFNYAVTQLRSEVISHNDEQSNDSAMSGRSMVCSVITFYKCLL
jgi:hypothetical protein